MDGVGHLTARGMGLAPLRGGGNSDDQRQDSVAGRRTCTVLAVATGLLFVQRVKAADEYPATGYFLGGLSAGSRWNEILAKPGIKADFPFVAF